MSPTVDNDLEVQRLQAVLLQLQQERDTLRSGLASRQRIGFITGVLGQRYGLAPDAAWELLVHVSQDLNVKARRVAEVLLDAYCGHLCAEDVDLAAHIAQLLPPPPHSAAAAEDDPTAYRPAHHTGG